MQLYSLLLGLVSRYPFRVKSGNVCSIDIFTNDTDA
jgi:hypothetical protein